MREAEGLEYPYLELNAADWLALAQVPSGLVHAGRDVYTSDAGLSRKRSFRKRRVRRRARPLGRLRRDLRDQAHGCAYPVLMVSMS
jgi:hypothetical protein